MIIGTRVELIVRVDLYFGHRLELRFIERRHLGFGRAKLSEMLLRRNESPVIGERRPIAPREAIGFRGGGDCRRNITRIAFELSQYIEGIGVEERIRPALSRVPNVIEVFPRFGGFTCRAPGSAWCSRSSAPAKSCCPNQ